MFDPNHTLALITAHGLTCGKWRENNWRDGMCKVDVRRITHLLTTMTIKQESKRKKSHASPTQEALLKGAIFIILV